MQALLVLGFLPMAAESLGLAQPAGKTVSPQALAKSAAEALSLGQVVTVRNFVSPALVERLRADALGLQNDFQASGLTNTASKDKQGFSGNKDRLLFPLLYGRDLRFMQGPEGAHVRVGGDEGARAELFSYVDSLRRELALQLERPTMSEEGLEHEVSYSIYGPGAFLARHLDEHHEETKGVKGWMCPSRRSISWLLYLNDPAWDSASLGGALRCFTLDKVARSPGPLSPPATAIATATAAGISARAGGMRVGLVGAHDGNLQVGWLRVQAQPPQIEASDRTPDRAAAPADGAMEFEPVFMDCWTPSGLSVLYMVTSPSSSSREGQQSKGGKDSTGGQRLVISQEFDSASKRIDFRSIVKEEQRGAFSPIEDQRAWARDSLEHAPYSNVLDVNPAGGTLVLFDSVAVPHEVTATTTQSRLSIAGWFHEAQQIGGDGAMEIDLDLV